MKKQFTKKDLRTGDIIVTKEKGNVILIGNRFKKFEHLNNIKGVTNINIYNDMLDTDVDKYSIEKVYRIKSGYDYSLKEIIEELPEKNVELIWKREESKREIDWTKVPPFTRVKIKTAFDGVNNRYFLKEQKTQNDGVIYLVTKCDEFTHTGFDCEGATKIEIYDKNDIKEEWYK